MTVSTPLRVRSAMNSATSTHAPQNTLNAAHRGVQRFSALPARGYPSTPLRGAYSTYQEYRERDTRSSPSRAASIPVNYELEHVLEMRV